MDNIKNKLASRKFWLTAAAFLASIGASLAGYFSDNETLCTVGVVCTMLSAAIYAAAEAYVDAASASANTTAITANSNSAEVVKTVLGTSKVETKE